MADDDEMRLQAVVVDKFSAPLKKLREDLKTTGSVSGGKDVAKDWKSVSEQLRTAKGSLEGILSPLRAVGIGSLGALTSITGLAIGLKNTAEQGRNLGFTSRALGLTVDKLRELQALGEHFDLGEGQVAGSLKTLQDNLNELLRNWGNAYNQLRGMNLGWLAEDIKNAAKHGGIGEAFETILKDLEKIPDPVYRRQIAQLLLGSDQWAVVAAEQSDRLRAKIKKGIGTISPEQQAAEDRLANSLKETNRLVGELWTRSAPLLDGLNTTLNGFNNLMRLIFGGKPARDSVLGGLRRNYDLSTKPEELAAAERRLAEIEKGLADAKARGLQAPVEAFTADRQQLIEEITKLRKEIEELNKKSDNPLLQNQSFLGGIGMPRVIPAMYSGGGAASGGGLGGGSDRIPGAGSGGMPGGGMPAGKRSVARAAAEEMRRSGLSEKAIAGIFANVQDESGFNPNLRHPDQPHYSGEAHYAHGLFQEGGAEWNRYAGWMAKNYPGGDWRDPRLQSRFLMENLKTNYSGLWKRMQTARSPEEAAELFLRHYLKPAAGPMAGRAGKYRRGVPGLDRYGVEPPASRDAGPAQPADPAPQKFEGGATLHVRFDGAPAGMRTRLETAGMFRETRITRVNRQATQASDYVA